MLQVLPHNSEYHRVRNEVIIRQSNRTSRINNDIASQQLSGRNVFDPMGQSEMFFEVEIPVDNPANE